jgi:hypothetical protein
MVIEATREDVRILSQALNELCNGVRIAEWEFNSRMGATKDEVRAILNTLTPAGEALKGHRAE